MPPEPFRMAPTSHSQSHSRSTVSSPKGGASSPIPIIGHVPNLQNVLMSPRNASPRSSGSGSPFSPDMSGLSLGHPRATPAPAPAPVSPPGRHQTHFLSGPSLYEAICQLLEEYFSNENLKGDIFLLKNMDNEGYVRLDLLLTFGRVKKLTNNVQDLKIALELSTTLLLSHDGKFVGRKNPLSPSETYHGKLARTAVAYNLPPDASIASLKQLFSPCGEIEYLQLLKKSGNTGRNAVLKPPIAKGDTYAIVEFQQEEMAKRAVLTLDAKPSTASGHDIQMHVVLFDGTNAEKLRKRMAEEAGETFSAPVTDRRRSKSVAIGAPPARPVHVEAVGEGLDDLKEGRVETGTVYSIRGAGGLINPIRYDNACISFRLVLDDDGQCNIQQGDYVSFTVGKNKKSGRKYASKVRLEYRPPGNSRKNSVLQVQSEPRRTSHSRDHFGSSSDARWTRNRSHTVGVSDMRRRSMSVGQRPQPLFGMPPLSVPESVFTSSNSTSTASGTGSRMPFAGMRGGFGSASFLGGAPLETMNEARTTSDRNVQRHATSTASIGSIGGPSYRQAIGPDGTRGFIGRNTQESANISSPFGLFLKRSSSVSE